LSLQYQVDLECAAICRSTAEIMSLGSEYTHHLCRVCADVCNTCSVECEKHAQMVRNIVGNVPLPVKKWPLPHNSISPA